MIKKDRLQVTYRSKASGITIENMLVRKPYGPYDVRCDRQSPLGNHVGGTAKGMLNGVPRRDISCDAYEVWFKEEVLTHKAWAAYEELMRLRAIYREYGTLRIYCWCSPQRCHCLTIKSWLEKNY
jgi:hypothetical protein